MARTALSEDTGFRFMETYVGLEMPNDIIEFVVSDKWLNRPNLYPRQATLLKLIFLQEEMLTQYDHDVIGEWTSRLNGNAFMLEEQPEDVATWKFSGDWGIQPDILDRLRYCRDVERRPWFRQVLNVSGRRGSKGHIGALCGAYVLWTYMAIGDPRYFFGVDRSKRLSCQVFAGKKDQAKANQWRDLVNVIMGAPCYDRWISTSLSESLTVFSPSDMERQREMAMARKSTEMDLATFEIIPKEATTMAARGPASFMQYYDEGAHMVSSGGASRSMADVYDSATPALDQFGLYAFIYSGSSPWTMDGKFYEVCEQSLTIDAQTRRPVYPENLIVQLASWDIYGDWERTKFAFPARPASTKPVLRRSDGVQIGTIDIPEIVFAPLRGAIQQSPEEDPATARLERANPETFRVERRAKWATAMDAYIPQEHVKRMFAPVNGEVLTMQIRGVPTLTYSAHGDPGRTGSNFGYAIGHRAFFPGSDLPHVVFDYIKGWTPGEFENMEMDYLAIEEAIGETIDAFLPDDLTFDQWQSTSMIQRLQKRANKNYKRTVVSERQATAPLNWRTAETFKVALSMNLIHAPYYELAELECLFLRKLAGDKVDHPDTGPVTTKDVYDAMSIVVHKLIGNEIASFLGQELSALGVGGAMAGPRGDDMMNDIAAQFSGFGRTSPARGGNRFQIPPDVSGRPRPVAPRPSPNWRQPPRGRT